MARTVIAFVGENRNGILDRQSRRFNALLEPMGLEGHLVQLGPDSGPYLAALLQHDVAWAWGYAGVGARITLDGASLWSRMQVPFVSVLADAPYIMPPHHDVPSPWVANGYIYQDWLAFQRRHVRSGQLSALLPIGVVPNPHRTVTRWSDRPLRMVFVKTGGDPDAQRHRWDDWPARLRPVLHDSAALLVSRRPGPIAGVVLQCLAAHGVALDHRPALLFGLLHELDTYVRSCRATAMARALAPLPVDIIGDGWEHLAHEGGRARFRPPIPADELEALYSRTQILVNVTPNLASGAHERVLRGFEARCRVLSDDNDFSRDAFRAIPSYQGVDRPGPALADQVAAVFHDPARFDDRLDQASAYVAERHDPAAFLSGMAGLAETVRLSPAMPERAMPERALDAA